jgi:hypothetical protein
MDHEMSFAIGIGPSRLLTITMPAVRDPITNVGSPK